MKAIVVTCMGSCWKVSARKYKWLLMEIAADRDWDPNDYGQYIGELKNITDITSEQAKDELKDLRRKPKKIAA